jgi:hypothetical protein
MSIVVDIFTSEILLGSTFFLRKGTCIDERSIFKDIS